MESELIQESELIEKIEAQVEDPYSSVIRHNI